jgi:hypothetical protein
LIPSSPLRAASIAQPESGLLGWWAQLAEGTPGCWEGFRDYVRGRRVLNYLTLDTTGACDLTCAQMCYYNPAIDLQHREIDQAPIEKAIADAVEHLGLQTLVFAGKEPFLNPRRLFGLLSFCGPTGQRSYRTGVITNGRHFERHWDSFSALAGRGCIDYLDISIDSADPAQHDLYRGVPGTWQKATSAAMRIRSDFPGIDLTIPSVLRKDNRQGILNLIEQSSPWCSLFQIQPIQPPPYSILPPLRAEYIVRFIDDLVDLLDTRLHGCGIRVSVELIGLYLLECQQHGFFAWDEIREDSNATLAAQAEVGGNQIVFQTEVFPLQAWKLARILYDGTYLAHMHFLQDANPRRLATGSLRELGIVELFERATGPGSYFDQIITSRAQHDCIRRPCWGNCFGLWNGAENSFVNNMPLSSQPALCQKTTEDFTILQTSEPLQQ